MSLSRNLTMTLLLSLSLIAACTPPPPPPVVLPAPPEGGSGPAVFTLGAPGVVRIEAAGRTHAGFLVSASGEILTVAHALTSAPHIEVFVPNRPGPIPATLVGYDAPLDLALLQLTLPSDAPPLPALDFADTPLAAGEEIWTLGHPEGYDWTLADGIVSRVHPDDPGSLLTSFASSPGFSGAPVLRYGDGNVRVAGVLSHLLSSGGEPAFALGSAHIQERLEALRAGERRGFDDAKAFLDTLPNRSPLVHQLILAQRVTTDTQDRLEHILGNLEVDTFPSQQTLELRTTWRYHAEGPHRSRYRVLYFPPNSEEPELIHLGPERTWSLPDPDASFVHDAEIDIAFPRAGLYAVTVDTDGVLSSVFPFLVTQPGASPPADATLPYAARPAYHALVVAADIQQDPPNTGPVSITNPFNLIQANRFPNRAVFSSWTRWGYQFAGSHSFRLVLVDSRGNPLAEGQERTFQLPSDAASYEHIAQWDVDFPAAGLYVILCYTDGAISNAIPLWIDLPGRGAGARSY